MAKKTPPAPVPAETPPANDPVQNAADSTAQPSPQQPTRIVTSEPETITLDQALSAGPAMPEVQDHAVAAARERAAEAQEAQSAPSAAGQPVKGITDERGRPFDPAIHETGPDGKGIIGSRTGFLRMRRGGASKGGAAPSRSKVSIASKSVESAANTLDAARNADMLKEKIASTAAVSTEMVLMLGQAVGGEEFAPEAGEKDGMTAAFVNYYTIRGVVDLPPEVMLGVCIFGYVGKRWNRPIFAEKRKAWWAKIRGEEPAAKAGT